uniref:Uncharacterized protein n=1 Tax=Meloidogyne enterolobii TaxID=390850 RepID=A0A6V7V2U8_MELEN|nr:unnamed protein product [Meloidogyne enterolobii]
MNFSKKVFRLKEVMRNSREAMNREKNNKHETPYFLIYFFLN